TSPRNSTRYAAISLSTRAEKSRLSRRSARLLTHWSNGHCNVWTALADQGLVLATARVVGAVMSSAFLRGEWVPLALMLSADPEATRQYSDAPVPVGL